MTLTEFLEYVRTGGAALAPVFAILYWLERDERRSAQKENAKISKETAAALTGINNLFEKLLSLRPNGKGR